MADLLLRIVGKDDASPAFNQVASASRRLDASTKTLAASQTHSHRAFSATKRILTGIATSYAAIKVGQFAKESIQAASDVNEALSATDVVFKKQSNTVKKWSSGAAQDFGQTRTQALNTARQFGTLFKSADVGGKRLSTYSTGLTELASDIASFNNVPVQQAIDDLTSGLTGQVEPMRKYGVFLSANALKAEAMRMGIADGTSTLTDQQRTLAAYNVILRQTGVTSDKFAKQFGDFDRTAGGFANQTRILTANWQGFKGAFGQAILPLATGTIKGLNQIIPQLSQSLAGGNLGKTLESWGPKAESFFTSLRTNLPQISGIAGDFADAAGIIGSGLKGVFDTFNSLPDGVRQGIIVLGTAAATMKMLNRAAGGGGLTAFGNAVESIPHAVVRAGMGTAAAEAVKAVFGNRIGTMTIQAGVVNVNGAKVNGGGGAAGGNGGLVGKAAAGGVLATAGVTAIALGVSTAIIMGLNQAIKTGWKDTAAWQRDVQASNKARAGSTNRGTGYSTSTDGGIRQPNLPNNSGRLKAETSGWRETTKAAKEHADAVKRLTGIDTEWGNAAKSASLKGTLGAKAFAGAVKGIPDKKHTRIAADGADQARGKVRGLGGAIGGLKGKTVPVRESGAAASKGRVRGLGGAIGGLKGKTVKVAESGASEARTRVQGLGASINAIEGTHYIDVVTRYTTQGGGPGKVAMQASGGYISGPGGPTDDAIPARLSNGEYVIRASAVKRVGRGFLDRLNAGQMTGFKKGSAPSKDLQKEIRQAKAEAARQARLAKRIDNRNLGEAAQSYLSGLSSKAALLTLSSMSNKQLRKVADRSGSLGALSTRRQNAADATAAMQSLDADRVARRFSLLSPADRKAEINAKITQNANAIALAKGKEKTRLIEKQRDLEQQLADAIADEAQAAKDAAEAQAAKEDAQLDKVNQLRDAVDGLAGGYRSFASISTTAVNDVTDAQTKLSDANDAVAAAQKKMDLAGSDRERAAAAAELAKAIGEQRTAQQGVNEAGKPSSGSIRGNMATRLQKIRDFSGAVKKLKDQGLNATTLSDILGMGPEQGYDFAKALLDGGLGDINDLQNQITAESASLGYMQYGTNAASDQLTGYAAAVAAGLQSGSVVLTPAPVTLVLDGRVLSEAMIAYQRQMGR